MPNSLGVPTVLCLSGLGYSTPPEAMDVLHRCLSEGVALTPISPRNVGDLMTAIEEHGPIVALALPPVHFQAHRDLLEIVLSSELSPAIRIIGVTRSLGEWLPYAISKL